MYHIQATDTRPLRMMIMTKVLSLLTLMMMMMNTTNDAVHMQIILDYHQGRFI